MHIYLYILHSFCSQYGPIFVVYRHAAASSVLNITNEWLISQDEDLVSFMVKIPHDIIKFNILVIPLFFSVLTRTPAHVLLSMKHLLSQDEGYKDGL